MAVDAEDHVTYYLLIAAACRDDLAAIRRWTSLKVGFDGSDIWVKDLDYAQANSVEVKTIPSKSLFYEQQGKLFRVGSSLPDRNVPPVLWTPITRALPVKLPPENHNYFGVREKIVVRIVPATTETAATAMIAAIATLSGYLPTAPAIRLQQIKWALLNNDKALLLGAPLLPVPGDAYWRRNNHLLPAGYDFELPVLSPTYAAMLDPGGENYIGWHADGSYFLIAANDLQQLSLDAFRESLALVRR